MAPKVKFTREEFAQAGVECHPKERLIGIDGTGIDRGTEKLHLPDFHLFWNDG